MLQSQIALGTPVSTAMLRLSPSISPLNQPSLPGYANTNLRPDTNPQALVASPYSSQYEPEPDLPLQGGVYRRGFKRVLDIVLVLAAIPFVLPVILLLALLVSLDGGKPFYTQERIGRQGRVYRIWKLRSMVHDADKRLEEHLKSDPAMRAEWESKQKLLNDPRITAVGRFLRKSSMDELPQLLNVLKGEMSLVGPRPMMPCQQEMYLGESYYELRPGITGSWQVSDRNSSSFGERVHFDNQYNRNVTLMTDVAILIATIQVVLRGTGH